MNPLAALIDRLTGRTARDPARLNLVVRERELVNRLAKVTGKTPAEVRAEARRRVLRIESESYRR